MPHEAPAPITTPPAASVDEHFQSAYNELRRMARARLYSSGPNRAIDTTALVHESWLRLARQEEARFPDRARFMAYVGRVMRSIIIDLVRERRAERRGGDLAQVTLSTQLGEQLAGAAPEDEILQVDEALAELSRLDPRMAQVVELRYFAGLSEVEIAEALGINERTVRRDWQQARLFLATHLR